MAVPARKISKTRGRMRRTHYKIEANTTINCPNCGAVIRPHRACPECGFYKGKNVLEKEENKEVKAVETKKETSKKETKNEEKKTTTKKASE